MRHDCAYTLVLLRHGNSDWNQKNLFTGWVDVRLSDQGVGRGEARAASCSPSRACSPTCCTPRVLTRAIQTANIALDVADRPGST